MNQEQRGKDNQKKNKKDKDSKKKQSVKDSDNDFYEDKLNGPGKIWKAKIHGKAQKILNVPEVFPSGCEVDFCDDCNLPVETEGIITSYDYWVDPKKLASAGYGVYLYFFFIIYVIVNLIGLIIITVAPYVYLTQVYSDELFDFCTEYYIHDGSTLVKPETDFSKCVNFVRKEQFDYTSFDWLNVWSSETMKIYSNLIEHFKQPDIRDELLTNFNLVAFVTIIALFIVNMLFISLSSAIVNEIDFNEESPSDYTLMISDIPTTENTEERIREFLKDSRMPPIHEISLTYKMKDIKKRKEELIEVKKVKRINKGKKTYTTGILCCKKEHPIKELNEKINTMTKENNELENEKDKTFNGVAFVTFNKQDEQEKYYKQFPNSFLSKVFINFGSMLGLYLCCCFLSDERKRRWRRKVGIAVARAPEPEDIIWEHLEFHFMSQFFRNCLGYFISILCIGVSFGIVVGLNYAQFYAESQKMDNIILKYGLSVAISLVIQIINFVVSMIFSYFAMFGKPWSYTNYYLSLSIKLTFFTFINTAIIPLVSNIIQYGWSTHEVLVNNMLLLFLMSSILSPFLSLTCYDLLLIKGQQWLFEKFNKDPKASIPSKTQRELNDLYEYPDMNIAVKYSQLAMSFLVTCFYMSIFPMGSIITLVGAIFVYFVEKFKFTKIYKKPKMFNQTLCFFYVDHFVFGLFMFAVGNIIFINDVIDPNFWEIVNVIMTAVFVVIPYKKLFRICDPSGAYSASNEITFEDAYFSFPFDYDRLNPKTQKEGIVKYLTRLHNKHIISDKVYNSALENLNRINVMELYHAQKTFKRNKTHTVNSMQHPGIQSGINNVQYDMTQFNYNLASQINHPGADNLNTNGQMIYNTNTNINTMNNNPAVDFNYTTGMDQMQNPQNDIGCYNILQYDNQRTNIEAMLLNLEGNHENAYQYNDAEENDDDENDNNDMGIGIRNDGGYETIQVNADNNNMYQQPQFNQGGYYSHNPQQQQQQQHQLPIMQGYDSVQQPGTAMNNQFMMNSQPNVININTNNNGGYTNHQW